VKSIIIPLSNILGSIRNGDGIGLLPNLNKSTNVVFFSNAKAELQKIKQININNIFLNDIVKTPLFFQEVSFFFSSTI
tara:strand:+ start:394 stop:627 length:234 start_codon:yes stop_codon:yes gene_type:complete